MALYVYVKGQPGKFKLKAPKRVSARSRKVMRLISGTCLTLGLLIVAQVVYPIVGWYLFVVPSVGSGITSPLATTFRPETSPLFPTLVRASETLAGETNATLYQPSSWFVGTKVVKAVNTSLKDYTLSIPRLKIKDAHVVNGGEDLKKNLIAWPTSVIPGAYGSIIIFGHSSLPQLSNPASYSSMFTHLMSLEEDDEIIVNYDGLTYIYRVVDKKIVSPTDLSVLEQRFDAPYIELITCEPPGTVWMRGVVRARLVD